MRRREFIAGLGSAAAWPGAVLGQQPSGSPRIGVLGSPTEKSYAGRLTAFRQGLKELGFVEGQNVSIDFRWANDHYDQLPVLATELVQRRVSVIVSMGNSLAARAAKSGSTGIPVVFMIGADPIETGLVASLNRPGGNVTGVTQLSTDLIGKRLQLLRELLPSAKVFGFLVHPDNPGGTSSGRSVAKLADEASRVLGGTAEVAYTEVLRILMQRLSPW
jgi:putative tryptophan/tyrosine transport system substrate-binding protein